MGMISIFSNVSKSNSNLWLWLKCRFFGSASVRVNSEEDLNSQVLSPQGTGGQDKDIWQETRLTYCQVSVTLSLTQMMAPYTTSTKTDEGDSFALRYHKITWCDVKALSSLQLSFICTQAMSVVYKQSFVKLMLLCDYRLGQVLIKFQHFNNTNKTFFGHLKEYSGSVQV